MTTEWPTEPADELGLYARTMESDPTAAVEQLRGLLKVDPLNASAYRLLAAALQAERHRQPSGSEPQSHLVSNAGARLMQADRALQAGDLPRAEVILRSRLRDEPSDADALGLLGRFAIMIGRSREAEGLLQLALDFGTRSPAVRFDLAAVLHRLNRPEESLRLLEEFLRHDPHNLPATNLKAAALARSGRFDEAEIAYRQSLEFAPGQARVWMHYGHLLKTMGRQEQCIEALRRALAINSSLGEAWWSLSDLKTVKLDNADIAEMEAALARANLREDDRGHLHFALGKAYEDAGDPEVAFKHYAEANRLRRQTIAYDPDDLTSFVREATKSFSASFFEKRASQLPSAADPIFILGMPRSGSTLVEQILASHPQVEGTMELPEVLELAERLGEGSDYLEKLGNLTEKQLSAFGQEYLERTRRYRKAGRAFFTDKMPNNWMHVPLIHLMLPNARIIDVRRHPLACCFSNFKQQFVGGQPFTYDLAELGRFYADYVRFMAHVDQALPGRVYRIFHEALVNEPEQEVRSLLSHLNLPFDEACLRFHENDRVVRSASSEQVRRPLNRQGIDQWRAFEPWLGPLKDALGPVLDFYPQVPPKA